MSNLFTEVLQHGQGFHSFFLQCASAVRIVLHNYRSTNRRCRHLSRLELCRPRSAAQQRQHYNQWTCNRRAARQGADCRRNSRHLLWLRKLLQMPVPLHSSSVAQKHCSVKTVDDDSCRRIGPFMFKNFPSRSGPLQRGCSLFVVDGVFIATTTIANGPTF